MIKSSEFVKQQNDASTPAVHRFVATAMNVVMHRADPATVAAFGDFLPACWDCIDAPGSLPAGSVRSRSAGYCDVYDLTTVERA